MFLLVFYVAVYFVADIDTGLVFGKLFWPNFSIQFVVNSIYKTLVVFGKKWVWAPICSHCTAWHYSVVTRICRGKVIIFRHYTPSRRDTLLLCYCNVGPASPTLKQHWPTLLVCCIIYPCRQAVKCSTGRRENRLPATRITFLLPCYLPQPI